MVALPSGTELDAYTILGVLGEGGFGVTYLAEDRRLGRKFAIKEYFPQSWASRDLSDSVSLTPNSVSKSDYQWGLARFIDEAKMLAKFRHPAIVQVSRIIEANNTAYMVLDYEEGNDLGSWLKTLGRPPSQAELDAILIPLLNALSLVHRNNILHRDISPDNIYIRADGSPVLLDFGAARDAIGHRSKTLSAIIKSGYSPQEQYTTDGKNQGPWTDIYALGATLYQAITGAAPPEAAQRAIEDDYVPAAQAAKGDYRPSFLAAIDHALKCHHKDRPQRVREWRRELLADGAKELAKTIAVGAPREALAQPARDDGERGPRGRARSWAAALLAVLLLGAGGSYYLSAIRPAERQQQIEIAKPEREDAAWAKARRENTIAALRSYLAAHPQGRYAVEAKRRIAALEESARTTENERTRVKARAKSDEGDTFARERQYDRAVEAYSEAIRLNPRLGRAYNGRGIAYGQKGEYARAIADFSKAIDLDPNYARPYYNRGLTLARQRQYDRAIADYDKAIELDPKYASAYNNRGIAYYNTRQYARAIADYDKAIEIDPKHANAYGNRGLAFEKISVRDKAIADFQKAVELRPGHRTGTAGLRRLGATPNRPGTGR